MFVRARVSNGTRDNAVLIPAASLSRNQKGEATVMLVDDKSMVVSRIVEAGRNFGAEVLIDEGLEAGDTLIVAGLQMIRAGIPVKIAHRQEASGGEVAMKTPLSNPGEQTTTP
jgi:membrane fusion protein (multidrug efflux system)